MILKSFIVTIWVPEHAFNTQNQDPVSITEYL